MAKLKPVQEVAPDQVLVSRQAAARMLGNVSVATIARLERRGGLKPVKLHPNASAAKTFYRRADVIALTQGSDDDAHQS